MQELSTEDPLAAFKAAILRALARGLDMKSIFDTMDHQGDGSIDANDVCAALGELGVHVTAERCKVIIDELNPDLEGKVSFQEFQLFARGLQSTKRSEKEAVLDNVPSHVRLQRFLSALRTVCVAQGLNLRDVFQGHEELTVASFMEVMSPIDSTKLLASHVRQWNTIVPLLHGNASGGTIPTSNLIEALESQESAPAATKKLKKSRVPGGQGPALASPTPHVPQTPSFKSIPNKQERPIALTSHVEDVPTHAEEKGEGIAEARSESSATSSTSSAGAEHPLQRKVQELSHEQVETVMGRYHWLLHQVAKAQGLQVQSIVEGIQPQSPATVVSVDAVKQQFDKLGIHFGPVEVYLFQRMFASANSTTLGYDSLKSFFLQPDTAQRGAGKRFGRVVSYEAGQLPYLYDDGTAASQYWLCQKVFRDIRHLDGSAAGLKISQFVELQAEAVPLDRLEAFMWRQFKPVLEERLFGEVAVVDVAVLSAIEHAGGRDGLSKALINDILHSEAFQTPLDAVSLNMEDVSNLKLCALDLRMPDSWLEDMDEEDFEAGAFPGVSWNGEGRVISIDWYDAKLQGVPKEQLSRLSLIRCLRLNQNKLSGEYCFLCAAATVTVTNVPTIAMQALCRKLWEDCSTWSIWTYLTIHFKVQ